jgi:hypothetical protein
LKGADRRKKTRLIRKRTPRFLHDAGDVLVIDWLFGCANRAFSVRKEPDCRRPLKRRARLFQVRLEAPPIKPRSDSMRAGWNVFRKIASA